MTDPLLALEDAVRAALADRFGGDAAGVDPAVHRSEHADFQADVALALARRLRRPPREVAASLAQALAATDVCAQAEVAGPGFVNLRVSDAFLARGLLAVRDDPRLGVPRPRALRVVVDHSAPNIAKEMHVGHLRSTIIGDALARLLAFQGHEVVRQNHIGDWGTPFGMMIEHRLEGGAAAGAGEGGVGDLNELYRLARARFDADPGFADRARLRVVALQTGEAATRALWRDLVDTSVAYLDGIYRRLGIGLTPADVRGESFYNPLLPGLLDELAAKGLLRESQGAACVFPPGFAGRDGQPLPLIVRKADGGFGYAATDLAALRYRRETLRADRIVYVVGAPQAQHFQMLFAVARQTGWLERDEQAVHVAFGSVLGEDRKVFRTRAGGTIRLADLLDEAVERARAVVGEKSAELGEAEREEIAAAVGVGAVKYADLSNDRIKDYVFDWSKMLSFDGHTAPYLMYAHARIGSILRKAGAADQPAGADAPALTQPEERALALALLQLPSVVARTADALQPHRLCAHLYDLAGVFTRFYERCPVLKAEGGERGSRLLLCRLTARALATGLGLLGIAAPERM